MEGRRSYWQQQYEDAQPPRLILWCGAHRWLVRALGGGVLALVTGLLVGSALDGGSLVSPILDEVT